MGHTNCHNRSNSETTAKARWAGMKTWPQVKPSVQILAHKVYDWRPGTSPSTRPKASMRTLWTPTWSFRIWVMADQDPYLWAAGSNSGQSTCSNKPVAEDAAVLEITKIEILTERTEARKVKSLLQIKNKHRKRTNVSSSEFIKYLKIIEEVRRQMIRLICL